MCMSADAYKKKLWGPMEKLCQMLADRPLPALYQKLTSSDIGIRTNIGFTGELSILIDAHSEAILEAGDENPDQGEQLSQELLLAADGFKHLWAHFEQAARDTERLSDQLRINRVRVKTC